MLLEAETRDPGSMPAIGGYSLRPMAPADTDELGRLYFDSYDAGDADESVEAATADIKASFEGAYGELWLQASPVVECSGAIVGAIMTVRRAPWEDVGECPFIIELFVDRAHRRRGLARWLVCEVLASAYRSAEHRLQLRVDEANSPALALYRSLGFVEA